MLRKFTCISHSVKFNLFKKTRDFFFSCKVKSPLVLFTQEWPDPLATSPCPSRPALTGPTRLLGHSALPTQASPDWTYQTLGHSALPTQASPDWTYQVLLSLVLLWGNRIKLALNGSVSFDAEPTDEETKMAGV